MARRIAQPPPFAQRLGSFQGFGRDDLDAEAAEPDIRALARRQQPNRGDAEVAQDLRAEADLAPLHVALALRAGAFLADHRDRHARGAVAQIDEDTPAGRLEMAQ